MTVIDLSYSGTSATRIDQGGLADDVRRWSLRALALLSVLNALDVVLTKAFLRAGLQEGNPLMVGLVQDWRMGTIKAIILLALFAKTATAPASVTRACMLWGAVGVYAVVSYVNWTVLQQLPV
jgi:hypothetical protein